MIRVADALAEAKARGVDRLDAHLLLARVLERPRTWLLAHDDAAIAEAAAAQFASDLRRRAAGEPLAYIVGEKEFHGLLLKVDARVLVPRPDTEVLVDWAIELLRARRVQPESVAAQVVDLGTGSGAIALALKQACPASQVVATDANPAALAVAERNARRLGLAVSFAAGAWWDAVPGRRFDLALSNPPYIAGADLHLAALGHEPHIALTSGGDGLGSLRQVIADAGTHLRADAWLLLEHGHDQAEAVRALLRGAGFVAIDTRADLAGLPRCTGAQRRPATPARNAVLRPRRATPCCGPDAQRRPATGPRPEP